MEEIDWEMESDEELLESCFWERGVPIFVEIEIEESDSFISEFSSGLGGSVHGAEVSRDNEEQESSSPHKVTQLDENGIREKGGKQSSTGGEAGRRTKRDEAITEGILMTRTEFEKGLIPAERELDEGTSDCALKEIIDESKDGSSEKVDVEVTGVGIEFKKDADKVQSSNNEEARKDADKVQSSDHLEAAIHAAVELNSTKSAVDMKEVSARRYNLISGGFMLPDPTKEFGGEDAYFIVGQNWLGVADGVGAWAAGGISAGDYARELMDNCKKIVSDGVIPLTTPKEVIIRSALEAQSPGSSTILVSYFDGQVLHVANIGDSGFIVIRNGTVYEKSTPRQFGFNCPYQIQYGDDPAELLEEYRIDLEEGDVIVTATDGLFDNLYDQEIASIVSRSLQENLEPKVMAEILAKRANEVGGSEDCRTPFAEAEAMVMAEILAKRANEVGGSEDCRTPFADTEAMEQAMAEILAKRANEVGDSEDCGIPFADAEDMEFGGDEVPRGGKLDDVTVVVSLVQKRPNSQME
ncbi:Phosphoprotein phosphatase [Bertholletia excelsa]